MDKMAWVILMTDGFVSWLQAASDELELDVEYLLARNNPELGWFRGVYASLGPISSAQLRLLAEEAREKSAKTAFDIIKKEVESYHRRMLDVSIEESPGEWVEGSRVFSLLGKELRWLTVEPAIVDIGDTVQGEIMERDGEVWPVCKLHGFGLHLEMIAGRVVWWCRPRSHAVRTVYPR